MAILAAVVYVFLQNRGEDDQAADGPPPVTGHRAELAPREREAQGPPREAHRLLGQPWSWQGTTRRGPRRVQPTAQGAAKAMEELTHRFCMGRFAWGRVEEETLRAVAEEQGHRPLVEKPTEPFELSVIELEGDRYPIVGAGSGYLDLGPCLRINDDGSYRFREDKGTLYVTRVEMAGILTVYPWKEIGDEVVISMGQDLYRVPRRSPFEDDDRIPIERHPKTVRAMAEKLGLPKAVIRAELEAMRREGRASKIKF